MTQLKDFNTETVIKEKSAIQVFPFQVSDEDVTLTISGNITTSGISKSNFGKGKKKQDDIFSVGIELTPENEEILQKYLDILADSFDEDHKVTINEPVKRSKKNVLYLKLKTTKDGKKFNFDSNIKITPRNTTESESAETVEFTAKIGAYVSYNTDKDKKKPSFKAGIYFTNTSVNFTNGNDTDDSASDDEPKPKRQKSSE